MAFTIGFDPRHDISVRFRHSDGKEEHMELSRIVQAYATVKGLGFTKFAVCSEACIGESGYNCRVEEDYNHQTYLNLGNFKIRIPDIKKVWTEEEATNVWKCIDHLVNM